MKDSKQEIGNEHQNALKAIGASLSSNKGKVLGSISVLMSSSVQKRLVRDWKLLSQFLTSLAQSSIHDDVNILKTLFSFYLSNSPKKKKKKKKKKKGFG